MPTMIASAAFHKDIDVLYYHETTRLLTFTIRLYLIILAAAISTRKDIYILLRWPS